MRKKDFFRIAASMVAIAFSVSLAAPAGAYYIGVPQSVSEGFTKLKQLAQEGQIMQQQPMDQGTLGQFQPMQGQTGPAMGSDYGQMGQNQQFGQNQMGPNQQQGSENTRWYGSPENVGPEGEKRFNEQQNQRRGQEQQQQQQDQKRQLQDMKRNLKPMENNLKQFEKMVKSKEKQGQKMTPEMQQKLDQIKTKFEAIQNAQSADEMQELDMGQLGSDMQELEQSRREMEESQRRMQDLQRNMKMAEQGLAQFEKQVNMLTKKGVSIPAELKADIQKIKTIFAAVKKAKSWEELEAIGIDDLQELMMGLDQYRQQLEMLSRWPQTQQQVSRELKNLEREYKRSETMVKNLAKKGIDLSAELGAFKEAIDKIKAAYNEAAAKVKSGTAEDIEAAFELLEGEVFGQMEDVWQYQRIIMTMSNLGRFQSDFKRRIADAQRMIAQLKRQKIDTSELAVALNEINEKGKVILAMLKEKPIDQEAVMDALQELEGLGSQFEEMIDQVSGEGEEMPWEQGPQQFKSPLENFSGVQKLLPKKSQQQPQPSEQIEPTQ